MNSDPYVSFCWNVKETVTTVIARITRGGVKGGEGSRRVKRLCRRRFFFVQQFTREGEGGTSGGGERGEGAAAAQGDTRNPQEVGLRGGDKLISTPQQRSLASDGVFHASHVRTNLLSNVRGISLPTGNWKQKAVPLPIVTCVVSNKSNKWARFDYLRSDFQMFEN